MLRRYAIANALCAFTRHLPPANQLSLVVRGVERTTVAALCNRGALPGVLLRRHRNAGAEATRAATRRNLIEAS